MNPITVDFPGTEQHQALLRQIVKYYQGDDRVLSVIVFGSLGRGNWDEFSDLDLDVVITDDAVDRIEEELRSLSESFAPLGEHPAIIFADGADEGEIVLESLMMLSIRYHPLADTSPNIVDSMHVLSGSLDHETIAAAGDANWRGDGVPLALLLDKLIRYAAVANVFYQRGRIWAVADILHHMRDMLMVIFARTHGGIRSYQTFEAQADQCLQQKMGNALPQYSLSSLRHSLIAVFDLLEQDLIHISSGQLALKDNQKGVLTSVRRAVESASLPGQ